MCRSFLRRCEDMFFSFARILFICLLHIVSRRQGEYLKAAMCLDLHPKCPCAPFCFVQLQFDAQGLREAGGRSKKDVIKLSADNGANLADVRHRLDQKVGVSHQGQRNNLSSLLPQFTEACNYSWRRSGHHVDTAPSVFSSLLNAGRYSLIQNG